MTDTVTSPSGATPEETPVTGDPAEGARWRGFTHKELYQMLHDGPGAAASAAPSRRWAEISSTLTEIGQDLGKALDLTGAGWKGRAAGAAYDRLSTTISWANNAGVSAGLMRTAVEDQGDHIAKARADMPTPEGATPVAPDPALAPAMQVVQAQVDAEPAEAAASSAEERAVEVMAAYETNTNTTTAELASFDVPEKLLPSSGLHQGHGGGLLGILPTSPSGLLGGHHHGPPAWQNDHHNDWRGPRNDWQSPGTSGSSAPWEERRPVSSSGPVAPGRTMGVAAEPLMAPRWSAGAQERAANNRNSGGSGSGGSGGNGSGGGGNGGSGGGQPGAPQKTGATNMPMTPQELQQAQAAAASQAATGAHPGAGGPMAPTAGGMGGGGQDKMAMRRFGMDAIGSSQWFGDNDEPAVGESPKRRFDLRQNDEETEPASILDDEHQLPPTVIGEGGR
jgi:hypothetical protein